MRIDAHHIPATPQSTAPWNSLARDLVELEPCPERFAIARFGLLPRLVLLFRHWSTSQATKPGHQRRVVGELIGTGADEFEGLRAPGIHRIGQSPRQGLSSGRSKLI
jgi:hypothetical protein